MDIQQPLPPTPAVQPPTPIPASPVPKKPNSIGPIVIILLIIASLGLVAASFLLPRNKVAKPTAVSPTSKVITAEDAQWKKYSDVKYKYFFYYPETWTLTRSTTEPSKFELRYSDTTKPGVITGRFLSKDEQAKTNICQNLQAGKQVCKSSPISATTKSYMELNLENNTPKKVSVMVARPNQVLLFLQITEPNFDSYKALGVILDTMKFGDEARINKIQLCPDSWSSDKTTVTYRSATFTADEIDQDYIKTNCKK